MVLPIAAVIILAGAVLAIILLGFTESWEIIILAALAVVALGFYTGSIKL